MRQELTAEVAASLELVWSALRRDLEHRGEHVGVLVDRPPAELRLLIRSSPGERLALSYELAALDEGNTSVHAVIEPEGPSYRLKRLITFGAVDRGHLDALAVGLANLQRHFEGDAAG